ncbi:hypothetical protein DPMN_029728 [Dreissena polymorpha]|uniref:Uncharacterized protein n=2 Tax=Dreissena polymorpha TaxID=45954 RepID=A0A9D4LWY6_DREPO|nr:hypothetical protein DPMN_029728 [Dreissena polymorpha]
MEIVECATPPSTDCNPLNTTFTNKYNITSTPDGGLLTIMNCNKNDYGTYTCVNNLDPSERSNSIKLVCKDPSESEGTKLVNIDTSGSNSNDTGKYLIMTILILRFI